MDSNGFASVLRRWRGVLVIVSAALVLELLSAAQYYFTRYVMEGELEKRAESDLTLKAILIKSNLNDAEDALRNHLWKIQAHLNIPDSAYITMRRLVEVSPHLRGAGVAFVPDFYPGLGRLFEVYARRYEDGTVVTRQIGGADHDYTQSPFYRNAVASGRGGWVTPYEDDKGAGGLVTTYSQPFLDRNGNVVGVAGVDVSLDWLADTINLRHIYPSSFIMVLAEDGTRVIGPSPGRVSRETQDVVYSLMTGETAGRKSKSGVSTVVHFNAEGRDGTIFCAFMKGEPRWKIAVVCYDDEVYSSLLRLRLWFLLLMSLAFGILMYVVWRFARGERRMADANRLLQEKTLEQERIDGELRIANGIQQALLPVDDPAIRAADEVEVAGRLIPAKAVGGDLYNVFLRDGKLFFCIGDVSGKGVPAALIMAVTQTLFHSVASRESNPRHIMEQINETACRNNKANIFVTLFVGVLDLPTGHLRYCNAGHEKPLVMAGGLAETLDCKANLPIGLFSDFCYEMQETTMPPGATLFLYTDGLTEARNAQRQLYGRERVVQVVAGCQGFTPKQFLETVIAEVGRFSGETEQSDDLTLLAISYTPEDEVVTVDEELTLPNDVREVARLSRFVKDVLERLAIGKPLAPKLRLALEEAVVNVMEYAYPKGTRGEVVVRVTAVGKRLKFVITDTGVAFNPTESAVADTTLSAEERPVGGLGILLMRQLMDSINYERTDGKNVLTMTKTVKVSASSNG